MKMPHRLMALATLLLALVGCGQQPEPAAVQPTSRSNIPTQAATPTPQTPDAPTAVQGSASDAPTTPDGPVVAGLAVDTRRALGDPNAPVTIVEYSDFQ